MDLNNYFVFDGERSSDLDTYIAGEGTFNAPERVYTMQDIPGRNGQIALDEGRFENYELKYPAFIFTSAGADFRRKISDLRNALLSKKGYKRLTDTYHPDEYRLAIYREGLETKPVQYNRAGEFDLVFDCKPQRFLLEGEVPISYPKTPTGEITTATGTSVSVDNAGENKKVITELKETIPLEIDDNGYGSTWAPGTTTRSLAALPNSLKTAGTITRDTVSFTYVDDNTLRISGYTNTEDKWLIPTDERNVNNPNARKLSTYGHHCLYATGNSTPIRIWVGPADGSEPMKAHGANVQFWVDSGSKYLIDAVQPKNYAEPTEDTKFWLFKGYSNEKHSYMPYTNQGKFVEQTETHLLQTCDGITASHSIDLSDVTDNYGGELEYITGAYTNKYRTFEVTPSRLTWTYDDSLSQDTTFCFTAYLGANGDIKSDTLRSGLYSSYTDDYLINHDVEGVSGIMPPGITVTRMRLRVKKDRLGNSGTADALKAYLPDTLYLAGERLTAVDSTVEKSTFLLYDGINTFTAGGHQLSLKYMDNPNIIENPTQFPSKPVIEVEGNGTLYIGNVAITIGGTSHTVIDCETMEAYDGYTSKNSDISISSIDFPVLDAGKTGLVLGDGITSVTVTPRWWKI